MKIPELSEVVEILLGDDEVTKQACHQDWEKFVLAKLLYKSVTTFSLHAIAYLVDPDSAEGLVPGDGEFFR